MLHFKWKKALLYHIRKSKLYSWWEGLPVGHLSSSKPTTICRSLRQFYSIIWRQKKILQSSNLILSDVTANKSEAILKERVSYFNGIKGCVETHTNKNSRVYTKNCLGVWDVTCVMLCHYSNGRRHLLTHWTYAKPCRVGFWLVTQSHAGGLVEGYFQEGSLVCKELLIGKRKIKI